MRYACPSRHGRVGSAELLLIQQSDEQNNKSKTADGTEISVLVHPCLIKILGLYHMLVSSFPQLYSLLPYRGMYEESFPKKKMLPDALEAGKKHPNAMDFFGLQHLCKFNLPYPSTGSVDREHGHPPCSERIRRPASTPAESPGGHPAVTLQLWLGKHGAKNK